MDQKDPISAYGVLCSSLGKFGINQGWWSHYSFFVVVKHSTILLVILCSLSPYFDDNLDLEENQKSSFSVLRRNGGRRNSLAFFSLSDVVYGPSSCKSGLFLMYSYELVAMAFTVAVLRICIFLVDIMDTHPHIIKKDFFVRNPWINHACMKTCCAPLKMGRRMEMIHFSMIWRLRLF